MKNILFSAYSLNVGGIETALITLLKNIHNNYNITLCLEKKNGIFLNELPENIKIITFTPNNNKNILIRKVCNFIKQSIFKIKYKNRFDFSACYATYSYSASFVARNASKNNCLWVHNDYMSFYNFDTDKYISFFEKLKIDQFKKVVFVSENDKQIFIEQFPKYIGKCIFCNNLIDYRKILEKSKEKIEDFIEEKSIVTFINLGRHDEKQKRISRIINSTKRLNQEGFIFRVILVGDGPDFEKYKAQAKDINNIHFLGAKRNPYPYLAKSDCLLMSSDFEGYPVVFIESLILGKPIITTDVSDSKKDIEGKYGIVVEKTEQGIYEGMKQYIQNGYTQNEFYPEKFNEEILSKLNKIIQ